MAERRTRYLVRHRSQLKFMAMLMLQMSIILAALGLLIYTHVDELASVAGTLPQDEPNRIALQYDMIDGVHGFYVRSLVLVGFTTLLLVMFGILASHKLAGPIVKLQGYLRAVTAGDYSRKISFRRYDHLDEFAQHLNVTVESLEQRRLQARELAIELARRGQHLERSSDREQMLTDMGKLVSEMRRVI